jgi:hypothetical protein
VFETHEPECGGKTDGATLCASEKQATIQDKSNVHLMRLVVPGEVHQTDKLKYTIAHSGNQLHKYTPAPALPIHHAHSLEALENCWHR